MNKGAMKFLIPVLFSGFVLQLIDHEPRHVRELLLVEFLAFAGIRGLEHVDYFRRNAVVVPRVGLNADVRGEVSELWVVGIFIVIFDQFVRAQLTPLESQRACVSFREGRKVHERDMILGVANDVETV